MKKVTKFFMAALLAGMCNFGYAQQYEWKNPVKPTETEVDVITNTIYAGYFEYDYDGNETNTQVNYSEEQLFEKLMTTARNKYANTYPNFALRNFKSELKLQTYETGFGTKSFRAGARRYYYVSATVVVPNNREEEVKETKPDANKTLSQAMNKALREVPEGSRLAIDRISSSNDELDRDELKDKIIDMLLDRGYRIVAKDYLEKLYEEIKGQENGIYNDKTIVKPDNFSAVGYYINVKVTETSLRVQVVNVSTGEYEGNATVNF